MSLILMSIKEFFMERLTGRRICKIVGQHIILVFNPPSELEYAIVVVVSLYQREMIMKKRFIIDLEVNIKQTKPLLDFYQ